MAKKPPAGDGSADAAKKRRGQSREQHREPRKGEPRKPVKAGKKPQARPAKKPVKKARESSAQAELPIHGREVPDIDVVEDADIIAETIVESPGESTLLSASGRDVGPELAYPGPEEVIRVEDQSPALSAEEQELSALYGEDLSAPAIAHGEYADRQTADEDRPMVPEINAREERKQQWQERRERRRQRRDERDRQRQERREQLSQSRPSHDARPAHEARLESRPGPAERPRLVSVPPSIAKPAGGNGADHDAHARVGTPLGDAAATVFAQLRNGQPLPVRQLAAMMRKRSLVETDPEQLWPQLKAELLGDERSYRTLGLRPRIVYRGRDLFAPGPVAMSQTADAEANVAAALSRLAGATHRALAARIAKASTAGFERLIHAYLVAAGYRDIAWVKRVGGISYATALAPGIERTVLVSARSGDQPIDRRGVGELRVGVEAKALVAGILFSARELSEDAERELERAGRSIAVICGDQLVAALIASGVGVVSSAAPLHYVDDQLLDELLAG